MTMKDVWSVVYSEGLFSVGTVKRWNNLSEKLADAKELLSKYPKGSVPYMDVDYVIREIQTEIEMREDLAIPESVSRETFEQARYEVERWNIGIDTFFRIKLPALLSAEGLPVHSNEIPLTHISKACKIIQEQGLYERAMEILNRLKALGLHVKMDAHSYKLYV